MSSENERDTVGGAYVNPGTAVTANARPYRSHKYPACSFCRRRKSRCTRELDSSCCLLCRLHGLECSQDSLDSSADGGPTARRPRTARRRRKTQYQTISHHRSNSPSKDSPIAEASNAHCASEETAERQGSILDDDSAPVAVSPENSPSKPSRHIVGPTVARDVQVLEEYMSPESSRISQTRANKIYLDDPNNPIVYVKIARQRIATSLGNGSAGYKQLETIEKVLEPLNDEAIKLWVMQDTMVSFRA